MSDVRFGNVPCQYGCGRVLTAIDSVEHTCPGKITAEAKKAARAAAFPKDAWGAGQPQRALLDAWAREMQLAFGHVCYLVGSACFSKTWRDIDVAMILDDDEWDHLFGPYDDHNKRGGWSNPFLCAMQIAFSTWAREATGLPVDFKIQRMTQANEEFNGPRCALGIMPHNDYKPAWRHRPKAREAES